MDSFSGSQVGVNTFVVTLTYLLAYEVATHTSATGKESGAVLVFIAVLMQSLGGFFDQHPVPRAPASSGDCCQPRCCRPPSPQ